ncbi:MAG: PKD domain-containing protein [Chitinophagaceae bacterium]|nr:MAG: PKD domain-containing protein [Chitinophagaceae bacterium]
MHNYKNLYQLLLAGIIISTSLLQVSCNNDDDDPPTQNEVIANFDFDCGDCEAPAEVSFTNTSQHAEEYSWTFGDGQNSTSENPTHTYSQAGEYDVTLMASSSPSNFEEITRTVVITSGQSNEYLRYEVNGTDIEATAFSAEITSDRRLFIRGYEASGNELPAFRISIEEGSIIGFGPGLNQNLYQGVSPDTMSYVNTSQVKYATFHTPSPGMHFFIQAIDEGADGFIQGTFSGTMRNQSGDELEFKSGEFRVMF